MFRVGWHKLFNIFLTITCILCSSSAAWSFVIIFSQKLHFKVPPCSCKLWSFNCFTVLQSFPHTLHGWVSSFSSFSSTFSPACKTQFMSDFSFSERGSALTFFITATPSDQKIFACIARLLCDCYQCQGSGDQCQGLHRQLRFAFCRHLCPSILLLLAKCRFGFMSNCRPVSVFTNCDDSVMMILVIPVTGENWPLVVLGYWKMRQTLLLLFN